jgi:hypothetical protein
VTYEDEKKNNMLHLAAKLAPQDQLELVSGAAFQMCVELLWFEVQLLYLMALHFMIFIRLLSGGIVPVCIT